MPFPKAHLQPTLSIQNHQVLNAKSLESKQACILIEQDNLELGKLEKNIKGVFSKERKRLNEIGKNSNNSFRANATKLITKEIIQNISC